MPKTTAYFYEASVDVAEILYLSPQAEVMLGYGEAKWERPQANPERGEHLHRPARARLTADP